MTKRGATINLNQDNWDYAGEEEEAGCFKMASKNDLKMRTIKRAKRRGNMEDDGAPSVFKNFNAFGSSKFDSPAAPPSFSFLSNDSVKPTLPISTSFPAFKFGNSSVTSPPKMTESVFSDKSSVENGTFNKNTLKPNSTSPNEDESSSLSSENDQSTFKFGVSEKSHNSPSSSITSFNFNPVKKPSAEKVGFSFGVNKPNSDGRKESDSFQFGLNSENNSKSTFTFGSSKDNEKEESAFTAKKSTVTNDQPVFKFGNNDNKDKEKSTTFASNDNLKENVNGSVFTKLPSVTSSSSSLSVSKKSNESFLADVRALNRDFLTWVKQQLEKSEYINLSPVLDDYKKYFDEINKTNSRENESNSTKGITKGVSQTENNPISPKSSFPLTSNSTNAINDLQKSKSPVKSLVNISSGANSKEVSFGFQSAASSVSPAKESNFSAKSSSSFSFTNPEKKSFTFGSNESKDKLPTQFDSSTDSGKAGFTFGSGFSNKSTPSSSANSEKKLTFSFGSGSESKSAVGTENKPLFTFGAGGNAPVTNGFSFGGGSKNSGFSFSSNPASSSFAQPSDSSQAKDEEEETEEPPKESVKEVKEDDAVYEKKVKLFYKKDDKYVDKGVGTLFLKPAGEKFQLVVRAHTNLGNILLNILLNKSLPSQRMGKNNVLLACVPNPPIDSNSENSPVSFLVRVKTSDDADELLKAIDDHKK